MMPTLKVGNDAGVSVLCFFNAGSLFAFLVTIELESPTPSNTLYTYKEGFIGHLFILVSFVLLCTPCYHEIFATTSSRVITRHKLTFSARFAPRGAGEDRFTERTLVCSAAAGAGIAMPNPADGFQNAASLVNWSGSLTPACPPICWYWYC